MRLLLPDWWAVPPMAHLVKAPGPMPTGQVWTIVNAPKQAHTETLLARQVGAIPNTGTSARTHVMAFRDIAHALTFCTLTGSGINIQEAACDQLRIDGSRVSFGPPDAAVYLRSVDLVEARFLERLVINGLALDIVEGLTESEDFKIASFFADKLPVEVYAANLNSILAGA